MLKAVDRRRCHSIACLYPICAIASYRFTPSVIHLLRLHKDVVRQWWRGGPVERIEESARAVDMRT